MRTPLRSNTLIIILSISISILSILSAHAQTPGIQMPKVVSPSPEAASLGKFGDIPVSLYNGTASVSLPLYSIPLGGISVPIDLSYHSNGIKVAEDASWVGLGFALSAGGTITRSVNGFDDFLGGGYLHADPIPASPAQDLAYYNSIASGGIDVEPDIFIFNFLGRSGKFVFKKGMPFGSTDQIVQLTSSPIKIICTNPSGSNYKFLITDEKGYRYYFDVQETSTTLSGSGQTTGEAQSTMSYTANKDIDVPTAWHLTKIVSPYNKEITFEYDQFDNVNKHKYYTASTKAFSENFPILHSPTGCAISDQASVFPKYRISVSQSATKNAFLKKITFDNGQIEFITSAREDMTIGTNFPGLEGVNVEAPKKLDEIRIKSGNQQVRSIQFKFDYFNKSNPSKVAYWRLRLDEILMKGTTDETFQKYAFEYNQTPLPSKESCNMDQWGYYNGADNDARSQRKLVSPISFQAAGSQWFNFDGANRNPDNTFAQAAVLTRVIYPTGGSVSLNYELNTYSVLGPQEPQEGTMYEAVGTPPGSDGEGYYEEPLNIRNATTVWVDISLIAGPSPNVWASDPTIGTTVYYGVRFAEILPVGSTTPVYGRFYSEWYNRPDQTSNVFAPPIAVVNLTPGDYIMRVYKHKEFTAAMSVQIQIKDNGNVPLPDPNKWIDKLTGGLRVKSITETYSPGNSITRNYDYTTTKNNYTVSSGKILAPALYFNESSITENAVPIGGGPYCDQTFQVRTYTSYSNIPVASSASGYHVGYDQVTEKWNNGTANGSTVHRFENWPEVVIPGAMPGTPSYGYHNLNGKIRSKDYLSATGEPVKSESYVNTQYNKGSIPAMKPISGLALGVAPHTYLTGYTFYDIKSDFVVPTEIKETTKAGANSIEQKKQFTYNTTTHYQLTEEKQYNSDGSVTIKTNQYPQDITLTGDAELARLQLITENRLAEMLTSTSTKNNLSTKTVTDYKIDPATQLVAPKTVKMNSGAGYTMEPRLTYHQYDNKGNLLSVSKENDARQSYIWDYQQSMPVAKVDNADPARMAYTSFEADGLGGWSLYPGSSIFATANAPTGKNVISGGVTKTVPTGNYIVGVWSYANTWVNGQLLTQTPAKIIGPWRYFEVKLNNVSSITVNGDSIDEVRLYEQGAQMTSYTYAPLTGMTSQNDVNNRITYYEYDDFGRLAIIRDENRNILKQYAYKYAEGTVGLFYNELKSQSFTRNDCGINQYASTYVYSVPANTYSGNTQPEANQQALDDIAQNGQVQANMHGTCTQYYPNAPQSGYYYNQNCPSGTNAEPLYLYWPAGLYNSLISQQDANTAVLQSMQQYANENGECTPAMISLIGGNYATTGFSFIFTNTATSEQFFGYISIGQTSAYLADVAPGTYNIEVIPDAPSYSFYCHLECGGNNPGWGSLYLTNITLDANCDTIYLSSN